MGPPATTTATTIHHHHVLGTGPPGLYFDNLTQQEIAITFYADVEIPDAVKWYSKKLDTEFGSPHLPVKSYMNFYFTGKIEVSKSSLGFTQEPTEYCEFPYFC